MQLLSIYTTYIYNIIGHQDGISALEQKPRMLVMVLLQDADRTLILMRDQKLVNPSLVDQRFAALNALQPLNQLLL